MDQFEHLNISPDPFTARFHAIIKSIEELNKLSERDFLSLGGKLNALLKDSRTILSLSTNMIEAISNNVLQKWIDDFHLLFRNFRNQILNSSEIFIRDKAELEIIAARILENIEELNGFKVIIKHLRVLGISTKIESARLGNDSHGFNTLADEVEKLSNLINDKVGLINSKSLALMQKIRSTTKDLTILSDAQNNHSSAIVNNITGLVQSFTSELKENQRKLLNIKGISENISNAIDNIVTFTQFNDITRQQLEHISETIADLDDTIRKKEYVDPHIFSEIHDSCSLQSIQMENSIRELTNAVKEIINSLTSVDGNINSILSIISHINNSGSYSDLGFIQRIKNDLNGIFIGIENNSSVEIQLSESIREVIATITGLIDYIQQIEDIGTEIELIALNARIKAAHTGNDGAALGILAEEIQKLSAKAKEQTGVTTAILIKVGELTDHLRVNVEEMSAGSKSSADNSIRDDLYDLLNTMGSMETEENNTLKILNASSEKLSINISYIISNFRIQYQAESSLNATRSFFEELKDEVRKIPGVQINVLANTAELFNKYTMQHERDIHNQYLKAINTNPGTGQIYNQTNQQDWDDNIELF